MEFEELVIVLFLIFGGAVLGSGITVWVQGLMARREQTVSKQLGEDLAARLEGRFEEVVSLVARMKKRRRYGLLALYGFAGPVWAQEEPRMCAINGTVVDAEFESAIAGAAVWLERVDGDLVAGRTTSGNGAFAFDLRSCESVVLRVETLGFEPAEHPVAFEGGPGQYQLTVQLTRAPLEVAELRVEVPRSLRLQETGFYARKAWVESTGAGLRGLL